MDIDRDEFERFSRAAFADGAREQAFWEENREWLRRDYPDQFVAVLDGKVVAAAKDLRDIEKQLAQRGYKPPQTWLRYIQVTPRNLVL